MRLTGIYLLASCPYHVYATNVTVAAFTTSLMLISFTRILHNHYDHPIRGWLGGAMVLGKLPVLGRPTIWITEGQGVVGWCDGAG